MDVDQLKYLLDGLSLTSLFFLSQAASYINIILDNERTHQQKYNTRGRRSLGNWELNNSMSA